MKVLIAWTLALVAAVALGLLLRYNDGMVTLTLPPYRFDMAANTALLSLIGGFAGLYLLLRTVLHLVRMPDAIARWRTARRQRQANDSLAAALVALHEGRLEQFDALARPALGWPATAGVASLLAARAAHGRGDADAREQWFARLDANPSLADARALFRAEIALETEQGEAAIIALDELSAKAAGSSQPQRLRLRALELAGRWEAVLPAAENLRRAGALDDASARAIRLRAYEELFEAAVQQPHRVEQLFKSLAREDRDDLQIRVKAIEAFAWSGDEARAAKLIDQLLASTVEPRLLILFSRLRTLSPTMRLGMAEKWLVRHPDDAYILATLGRLCLAEGLWGKAEAFLRRANELQPSPFTRLALAEMYDALGRESEASDLYRAIALEQTGSAAVRAADEGVRRLAFRGGSADATGDPVNGREG